MTRKARMAPCGGERPTGSSSRTRSRSVRESNRRTSAGTRIANGVFRAGPVTTTVAPDERPISGASTLRSSASSRTLPHHQPTRTQRERAGGKAHLRRTGRRRRRRPRRAARTIAGARAALASAIPTQTARTRSVGQPRSTMRTITARRGPAAVRPAPGRFPESRRDPRPSGSRRGRSGSRRSSVPSRARCPAVRRAPRPRLSSDWAEPRPPSRQRRERDAERAPASRRRAAQRG